MSLGATSARLCVYFLGEFREKNQVLFFCIYYCTGWSCSCVHSRPVSLTDQGGRGGGVVSIEPDGGDVDRLERCASFPSCCRTLDAVFCFRLIAMASGLCKPSARSSAGLWFFPELTQSTGGFIKHASRPAQGQNPLCRRLQRRFRSDRCVLYIKTRKASVI